MDVATKSGRRNMNIVWKSKIFQMSKTCTLSFDVRNSFDDAKVATFQICAIFQKYSAPSSTKGGQEQTAQEDDDFEHRRKRAKTAEKIAACCSRLATKSCNASRRPMDQGRGWARVEEKKGGREVEGKLGLTTRRRDVKGFQNFKSLNVSASTAV